MTNSKIDFEPTGALTMKKAWHIAYITAAIVVPVAVLVLTLVKGTFQPVTIPVLIGIAAIILVLDYTNISNKVLYNDTKIAFLQAFSKPKEYNWEDLNAIYSGEEEMRLEFDNNTKLYIALKYDGIESFIEKAQSVYEMKFGGNDENA